MTTIEKIKAGIEIACLYARMRGEVMALTSLMVAGPFIVEEKEVTNDLE